MNPTGVARRYAWAVPHATLALGWAALARWVVPPMLGAEHPGRAVEALERFLSVPPALFLTHDVPGRWREVSWAVLIALGLHLAIVAVLRRYDRRAAAEGSLHEARSARRLSLALGLLAAAFLALTIAAGMRQDYYFYLEMWYHVSHGQDPWFIVAGSDGMVPLNAYGPLFNLLAGPAWLNPMAPKLLFAAAYLLFAVAMIKEQTAGMPASWPRTIGLLALFWNPFVWVEVPFYGHFDVLVGLACLGAARAWDLGRDARSGMLLASGILLKFLPVILVPFLGFDPDRRRLRRRFLASAALAIAAGLGLSALIWGASTFLPIRLATLRGSTTLSIFYFLRGRYSPLPWLGFNPYVDEYAPLAQLAALGAAWSWWRSRAPGAEAAALVATTILVLLYRVGFPQYHMVPFVLASAWIVRRRVESGHPALPILAMAGYFGWMAAFDVYYVLVEQYRVDLGWGYVQQAVGLPTFLLGAAFVAAVVRAATPADPPAAAGPSPCPDV